MLKMANFGAGHGGHAGGDPPFRWTWVAPSQSRGAGGQRVRGATQNLDADDAVAANQGRKLEIFFEQDGEQTWQAVGENAKVWANLVGARVRNTVPFCFDKWDNVPQHYKEEVLEFIGRYFRLDPYLNRRENDSIRVGMFSGFKADCAKSYRNSKTKFKKAWYTAPLEDGLSLDELRQHPPPGMPVEMWNLHVDFFSGDRRRRIAEVNTQNRQQMVYVARQGRRSGARRRHAYLDATGHYPAKIDYWTDMHVDRQGFYISDDVERQHDEMQSLWEQVQRGEHAPMTEDEIMDQVLHERPGHRKGRGRIVPGISNFDPQPAPQPSPQFGQWSPFSDWSEGQGQSSGAQDSD